MATMQAVGFPDQASATREARKYIKAESPDFTLADVETFFDDADTKSFGWRATWGEDDAVLPNPKPAVTVGPDLGVKVETSEAPAHPYAAVCREQREAYFAWQASTEGNSGPEFKQYLAASDALDVVQQAPSLAVVSDNPEPTEAEPARNVVLAIEITSDLTEAVAKLLRGKIGGAVIRVCDADDPSVVLEEIPTTKPGQIGRETRDWTIKPVIASTANRSAQSRLDKIDEAGHDVARLEALLADISPVSNQTYTVMARRFCLARLCVAKQMQAEQYAVLRAAGFDVGEAAD